MALTEKQLLSEIRRLLSNNLGYTDAFNKAVADGTSSDINIPGHYPYNAERLRLFVNGARQFPEYGSVSQYNHATDVHELSPASGETVTLQTTERPRYLVQYEFIKSFAFEINQSLNSGDNIRAGKFNDNEGWYLEHNGSHGTNECDLVILRNGSVANSKTIQNLPKPFTTWNRYAARTNWYNVGNASWSQFFTYSNDSEDIQDIGEISVENGRGPQVGNLPLRYEVTASGSTTGLTLRAGSMAHVTLGGTDSITRRKTAAITASHSGASGFEPIAAFRIDPNRPQIVSELINLVIQKQSVSTDTQLIALAVDSSNTDASGFSTPNEQSSQNSVVEQTTSVSTFPNTSGTNVSNVADLGGYTIGFASLYTSGNGAGRAITRSQANNKAVINENDVIVIATDTGSTSTNITFEYTTEQNW